MLDTLLTLVLPVALCLAAVCLTVVCVVALSWARRTDTVKVARALPEPMLTMSVPVPYLRPGRAEGRSGTGSGRSFPSTRAGCAALQGLL
ncbi:hypothetical protein [Streptomyces sp. NPDC050585]|uniref:hypothetical protein n=1 Tax=Streptomyces sp. NPDC050585 TaxID=3365632 RepID=UPI0037B09F4A